MPPPRPKLPKPKLPVSPIEPFRKLLRGGHNAIEKAREDIHSIQNDLRSFRSTEILNLEPPPTVYSEPVSSQSEPISQGTACLPCCRDHLSTTSSALGEAIRFARDKGVKDPEAVRRIRIALDELNIMERIDLAPDETAKLQGSEKELAAWILKSSRELRHAITAIKDVDSMEQAAAKASETTEEFMAKLFEIPEEECETCKEIRERLAEFIESRKRERGEL